jgi:hypothetical protein
MRKVYHEIGRCSSADPVSVRRHSNMLTTQGPAIGQAVSRWLPNAAARVRAHVVSCGICGGQNETGAGFLRVLRFPLPILIPPTASYSSSPYHPGLV